MNELTQNSTPTLENLWAYLQETARLQQENERIFNERLAKEERIRKERLAEEERVRKERLAEEERIRKEKEVKEDRDRTAYEKKMKRRDEEMGRWSSNQGCFAEEYFYNSFDYGEQHFFGEHFDEIRKNIKPKNGKLEDEYDIVLYNENSVAIIEIKYKAHVNDLSSVLKKAETFRILCPDYKNFKIYLGLASMAFYPELEQKCMNEGIAIIKQVGDSVVINDGHLKVF
jgi:hypothetical protein